MSSVHSSDDEKPKRNRNTISIANLLQVVVLVIRRHRLMICGEAGVRSTRSTSYSLKSAFDVLRTTVRFRASKYYVHVHTPSSKTT
jgi:hypothetical protein